MSAETWKQIDGHLEYEVSDHGRVRRNGGVLKPYDGGNGYLKVGLSARGVVSKFSIHRLVAGAFHGPPPQEGMDAAHWNGDRHDNRASNLRWATRSDNMRDMLRHERTAKGERNGHARLTSQDVRGMRELRANGATYQALADRYGLKWQTVQDACTGRNWGHLEGALTIPRGKRFPTSSQLP